MVKIKKRTLKGSTLEHAFYIIFIIIIFLLVYEIINLKEEIYLKDKELKVCNKTIAEYEDYTHILKENIAYLNESLSNITSRYVELEEYISSTINELKLYEEEINEALAWFRENSDLRNSGLSTYQMSLLVKRCLKVENNNCEINLGCIYLLNDLENAYGFHYKSDNQSTNKNDTILSLKEFVENKGGDCEDYALFYKAEFNYLRDYCFNKSIESINIRTYSLQRFPESNEQKSNFFLDNARTWYVPNAYENILYNYKYMYVVCGNMENTEGAFEGHCVVALTQKDITTPNDLENEEAILIEPQTGEYIGKVGREITLYKQGTWDDLENKKGIFYIISDSNQYLYLFTLEKWTSYQDFKEKIDNAITTYKNKQS